VITVCIAGEYTGINMHQRSSTYSYIFTQLAFNYNHTTLEQNTDRT